MKMGDQEPTGSGSNRNGRYTKKLKPKKVPQRGMGVAQLEKIRMEEEVKNDPANLQSLAVSPHHFAQHNRPYLLNDNSYGYVSCNPLLSMRHHSLGTACPPNNAAAGNNLLSSTHTNKVDKSARFPHTLSPPYELTVLKSQFGVVQLGNQRSSPFSSLMMNGAINSSSAVFSSKTEPPSNQSPNGTYQSVQPNEAEKMVGLKRPCPFSLQDPSNKLLPCKFNTFSVHSNSGSFRDSMAHSNSSSDLHYTKYNGVENMTTSDGDFLKLASPVTMSLFPNSNSEKAQSSSSRNHQAELLKRMSTSPNIVYPLGSESQEQQPSFYRFLPEQNTTQDAQSTVRTSHRTEEEECIDLSLKL